MQIYVNYFTSLVIFYSEGSNRQSDKTKGKKEMFYLTTHSTHFIYGYMASDIW